MANKLVSVILIFIVSHVLAQERMYAISGNRLDLECKSNPTQDVTWQFDLGETFSYVDIYTCLSNQTGPCTEINTGKVESLYESLHLNVSRSIDASFLSLIPSTNESLRCVSGDVVKTFAILVIDTGNIKDYCYAYVPSIRKGGKQHIQLSCGYTFERTSSLTGKLTLDGLGQNYFDVQNAYQSVNGTLSLDDNFNNITGAYCMIAFPDIDVTRKCIYPAIIKTKYAVEGNGIIAESDDESEVDWQLFGKDGREDIVNRSWTRDEGRSLLLWGITEEDVGKILVWRTKGTDNQTSNGTIWFTVISDISGDSLNKPKSEDPNTAPSRDDDPFFVLTLLFLALWLITFSVGGIILFCREEKCKTSLSAIPSTSDNTRSPNSNHSSNVKPNGNVGSGEHGTPLVKFTTQATNPDITNTNNSAHTPVLERDDGNDDTLNRQRQGDSHLYFTLEKSPSDESSSRRASAPRWTHGDTNPATLDRDQDSHWQGYATVGDSNENATCSFDLGEYAEVGEHLLGKGPPVQSTRPPVRKKPGREEVKEDDISKLYGKVNK